MILLCGEMGHGIELIGEIAECETAMMIRGL